VNSPYTSQPGDALLAAQTSVGLVLGAVVWAKRLRPWPSAALLLAAIALAVMLPVEADFLRGLGATLGPDHTKHVLKLAAAMATVAAVATRQRSIAITAILGEVALWPIVNYIQDCDSELAAAHLAFFGLLVGLYREGSTAPVDPAGDAASEPVQLEVLGRDDLVAVAVGTVLACLVCWLVLHGETNSGDEWANTFQAALFAKLHAYGSVPHCSEALRSFWVFQYMGRSFGQYTPGWPYFMAPFVALHLPWLAGPASLGLLGAGVARLGRRAAAGFRPGSPAPTSAHVRAAGWFSLMAVVLSSTLLTNGASRYPHVFVAAMFAWSLEATCAIAAPTATALSTRDQRMWGAILGASAALLLATRPSDGGTLGLGLFVYFVYALVRRRVGMQGLGMAAAVGGVIGALTLIILRLQLGTWFKTGYSLTEEFYPWAKVAWSLPKPSEYRWGLPLATGSYCWWPSSPAVGLAGLAMLRGRARRLTFVFFCGTILLLALYTLLEIGRGFELGYGPRYVLPTIVPMAVGTGVVLAKLWTRATRATATMATMARPADGNALSAGGPAALALTAVALGVVRIAPMVYPFTYADIHSHNRLNEAIALAQPHNAVVFGSFGFNTTDPMDLTENLPLDLYPQQDVIIALDRGPDEERCVERQYRGRTFYTAIPTEPVKIVRR
jgi:hypothetical protein